MARSALLCRTAALLAVCSAVLHGLSLLHPLHRVLAAVMVAMLAACLYCAYELWTRDTLRAWVVLAVMNLAMVAVHLPMAGGHQHGGLAAVAGPAPAVLQWATAVAVVEALLAATVVFLRTRTLGAACQSGTHGHSGTDEFRGTTGGPIGGDVDRLPGPG